MLFLLIEVKYRLILQRKMFYVILNHVILVCHSRLWSSPSPSGEGLG
ncbi:MAG: hypothetical protein LBQ59_05725 [Candidatus Peribacteria bacterium]|nr:hypothetical protein [Candidatus Peribacteria bacterium]